MSAVQIPAGDLFYISFYIVREIIFDVHHCHFFKDECSFVSLRDVERAMQVLVWFYKRLDILGKLMMEVRIEERKQEGYDVIEDGGDIDEQVSLFRATIASHDLKIIKSLQNS